VADAIEIRGETIRLGQLIKFAGAAASGGEAKEMLAAGRVSVNGATETRRGRRVRDGDVVRVGERELRVVAPTA
jgi:ribosome-associated protein